MADTNVFITGAAEGSLAKALNGMDLPPWATEKTAVSLEKWLKKTYDLQTKSFSQAIKLLGDAGKGDGKGSGKGLSTDEISKFEREIKKGNDELVKQAKLRRDQQSLSKMSITDGVKLRGIQEKSIFTFLTLAAAGDKLKATYIQSFETTKNLLNAGVNLSAGFGGLTDAGLQMQQMVNLTNFRLQTLEKTMAKYNESINLVGPLKFSKALNTARSGLDDLGMGYEEQLELMGTLIESESNYSDIRGKTQKDLAQDALKLGAQLTKLSFVTGQSTTKILDNIKAISATTDSSVIAAVDGEEAAANMNLFVSSLKDSKLKDTILSMASEQVISQGQAWRDAAEVGQTNFVENLNRINQKVKRGEIDQVAAMKEMDKLSQTITSAEISNIKLLSKNSQGAAAFLDLLNGIRHQKTADISEAEMAANIKNKSIRAKNVNERESAAATPDKLFATMNSQIEMMTSGVKAFNDAVKLLVDNTSAETRSWTGAVLVAIGALAGFTTSALTATKFISKAGSLLGFGSKAAAVAGAGVNAAGAGGAGVGAAAAGGGSLLGGLAASAALPIAIAGAGAYLQHEMETPEGLKRRTDRQKEILDEKKQILAGYKEAGATKKAIGQVEKEIAEQEKLISDLTSKRTKLLSETPEAITATTASINAASDIRKLDNKIAEPPNSTITTSNDLRKSDNKIDEENAEKEKKNADARRKLESEFNTPTPKESPSPGNINKELMTQTALLDQLVGAAKNIVSGNQEMIRIMRSQ